MNSVFDRAVTKFQAALALRWLVLALLLGVVGCSSPGNRAAAAKQHDQSRREISRLQRELADRDKGLAVLRKQIEALKGFSPNRPADLFAPVKVEIASRSGGADYDGEPGDDGVTVYLRPLDADGDAVKAPGRITIQIMDNSNLSSPKLLGLFEFDDPLDLRSFWHSRFGTQHYTLKCPLGADVEWPASRRVNVSVEFVDFLTGRTLTAVAEVSISMPSK